jgi:hypothetical protein
VMMILPPPPIHRMPRDRSVLRLKVLSVLLVALTVLPFVAPVAIAGWHYPNSDLQERRQLQEFLVHEQPPCEQRSRDPRHQQLVYPVWDSHRTHQDLQQRARGSSARLHRVAPPNMAREIRLQVVRVGGGPVDSFLLQVQRCGVDRLESSAT